LNIKEFLKPTWVKIFLTLLIPIPVDIIMTLSTEHILDFYWYLQTPIIEVYTPEKTYSQFNPFMLLWIPFYLSACLIDASYRRARMHNLMGTL